MTLKALILAGGYGTKLRPLTLSRPTALIEFGNKPILFRQMDALIDAGVTHIILSVHYRSELIEEKVKTFTKNRHVEVTFSKEDEKLGPGGYYITLVAAFVSAKKYLDDGEPFFVMYGNVVGDYPFTELMKYHKKMGGIGTITVINNGTSEKPNEETLCCTQGPETHSKILGCLYVFEYSFLEKIPKNVKRMPEMIKMVSKDCKFSFYVFNDFWARLKNLSHFLSGSNLYLKFLNTKSANLLGHASLDSKKGLIDASVTIGKDCFIGDNVVIGENVKIGDGVYLNNCVVLSGSVIKSYSNIESSIIGWGCKIGKYVCVQHNTLLGEGVSVSDGVWVHNCRILPHLTVSKSPPSPELLTKY